MMLLRIRLHLECCQLVRIQEPLTEQEIQELISEFLEVESKGT
ncbi:hypothetical protein LINPERPRIM_LOCUS38321 [Linum perenne]